MARLIKPRKDIPKMAKEICNTMLADLEKAKRPTIQAIKCSLDNSIYDPKVGYLTPGKKKVTTELNVSSVQKLARTVFMLEVMLNNVAMGTVNSTREFYYIAKGLVKSDDHLKPIDFASSKATDEL